MAVRHADASGGYTTENQHEEKRIRGIRVSRRRSGAASEEKLDEWRKSERLEHEAPNTSASYPCVAREYLVSCEVQSRPGSVLVQKSGRVDDDVRISALHAFYWKDDLKRIELVEKWPCLNVVEKKICKRIPKILTEEKSWRTWKRNQNIVMDEVLVQNIVMDEELVQNVAMGEKIVKNFVMGAKIDPKVEMDLSLFKIDEWKFCNSVICSNCSTAHWNSRQRFIPRDAPM